MTKNTIEMLSVEDAYAKYPVIQGWFAEPLPLAAQISANGLTLPSAFDRIESAGGVDRMCRSQWGNLLIRNYEPIILDLAVAQPIVETEIVTGALLLGIHMGRDDPRSEAGLIRQGISSLKEKRLLEPKEEVVYLMRRKVQPQTIFVHHLMGLQATEEGLQVRKQLAPQAKNLRLLPRLRKR